MLSFRRHVHSLALLFVGVAFMSLASTWTAQAQTSSPKIRSISVVATTARTATVSFTVDGFGSGEQAEARIVYGRTSSYGSEFPVGTFQVIQGTDSMTITDLEPSTTYHYRLEVRLAGTTTITDRSADRSLTTKSNDSVAAPVVTVTNVDCIDTSCTVTFSTASEANVTLGWDTAFHAPSSSAEFCSGSGYPNCINEGQDVYRATTRSLRMTNLQRRTEYHYRLLAVDRNGGVFMTGNSGADLTITTSASSTDHTFSTGNCSEGGRTFPIGSCLPSGQVCTANGPEPDCTSACGFSCPSGQTCNVSRRCVDDPALNGSPLQCNPSRCYDGNGVFKNPGEAGCYASWSKCNANTILKVRKDRGCDVWLTCATSVKTEVGRNQPSENLCLSLAGCNSLGLNGQCNRYLPQGQCSNNPLRFCSSDVDCEAGGTCNTINPNDPDQALQALTFSSPQDIAKLANLSGNVVVGLDWTQLGGDKVIEGQLPWQLMRQVGGQSRIVNGDFEYKTPQVEPWIPVPEGKTPTDALKVDYEDKDASLNAVLMVDPVTQITVNQERCQDTNTSNTRIGRLCDVDNDCRPSGNTTATCVEAEETEDLSFSGAATATFNAAANEYYYAEARVRAPNGNPTVRLEIGHQGFTQFFVDEPQRDGSTVRKDAFVDVEATSAWKRVTIGPLRGFSGEARFAAVCADRTNCAPFWIDDVQIRPILQSNTSPTYLTPSCRLYPRSDAPACDFVDQNGVNYKGWRGYCLENDSTTGACVSWWPVDIIKGETSIFGTDKAAGYQDRVPLFYCAEARGNNRGNDFNASSAPYIVGDDLRAMTSDGGARCDNVACNNVVSNGYTIGACGGRTQAVTCTRTASGQEAGLTENEITKVIWNYAGGESGTLAAENGDMSIVNNAGFRGSSPSSPAVEGETRDSRITFKQYRVDDPTNNEIRWVHEAICPTDPLAELLHNCISSSLIFNRSTGAFLKYSLTVSDRTGNVPDHTAYQVMFYTKEACATVVQVVDPSGNNQAFAQRLSSNSYQVPDIGYRKSQNLQPYGGIVAPADAPSDPTKWGILPVETQSQEHNAPGQARGGSPYACNGNCAAAACRVNDMSIALADDKSCSLASSVNACGGIDSDQNSKNDDICTGGATAVSAKSAQTFSGQTASGTTSRFAEDHLKRLFAQSYGIWKWNNGSYERVENSLPGRLDDTSKPFVGWTPPGDLCPEEVIPAAGACTAETLRCNATTEVRDVEGSTQGTAIENAFIRCRALTACDGRKAECTTQSVNGTSVKYDNFDATSCRSVTTAGRTTWFCTGRCTSTATYTNAKVTPSNLPPTVKISRPAYPNDYCAVPPSVSNAKFLSQTGGTARVTGGSGSIGIQFNTNADPDQVPLKVINIDWGDNGANYDSLAYEFAPRNDPRQPHIFSHVYAYNRADNAHCPQANGPCTYSIRIQVRDNWGWCNDASRQSGSDVKCHASSTQWVDTGLKVIVEP